MLRLGKYLLLDELVAGPIGRIYLGEHTQLARRVALKLLPKRQMEQADFNTRLLTEARQICQLNHRNIVHVYDVDVELDRYVLVMEFPTGKNLAEHLAASGPMRFPAACGRLTSAMAA